MSALNRTDATNFHADVKLEPDSALDLMAAIGNNGMRNPLCDAPEIEDVEVDEHGKKIKPKAKPKPQKLKAEKATWHGN